jgi:hypothetical protein
MKVFVNLLLLFALSLNLNARSFQKPPPHTKSGDVNLGVRKNYVLKVGQRGFYLFNNSSAMNYLYKFKISNERVLKLDKLYQLTPFRENLRGTYLGQTTDYINFYKAIGKGSTTLTVFYISKGKVKFKDVIYILVQ